MLEINILEPRDEALSSKYSLLNIFRLDKKYFEAEAQDVLDFLKDPPSTSKTVLRILATAVGVKVRQRKVFIRTMIVFHDFEKKEDMESSVIIELSNIIGMYAIQDGNI